MKTINKITLTPEQTLVVNGLLSLLLTAITGGIGAAYQYYTQGGKISVGILINIALITFLVLFGKSLHDFVPGHAKDLIQSLQDSYTEVQTALTMAQRTISVQASTFAVQATPEPTQAQPPVNVVIHTSGIPDVVTNAIDPLASPLPAHIEVVRALVNTTAAATISPVVP